MNLSIPCLATALALPFFTVSCVRVADDLLTGMEASAAKDQIMLVRAEPPSFGHHRLVTLIRTYPDLGVFIQQKGVPDFLAEAGNRDRRYMILYYLRERQAFACRPKSPRARAVEFSGPYPITRREYETLHGFRNSASKKHKIP